MKCLACGNEMGERNICQVCGTARKNVLPNMNNVSSGDETQIMYENMIQTVFYAENSKEQIDEEDLYEENIFSEQTDKKSPKKKRTLGKILIASISTMAIVTFGIIAVFLIREKKCRESLPEYSIIFVDEKNDIVYNENRQKLYSGTKDFKYTTISNDYSKMIYLNDRLLGMRTQDEEIIIDDSVVAYIGTANLDCILYAKYESGGINVKIYRDGCSYSVKSGLHNIDNLVVSENGENFTFSTCRKYRRWERGSGKYVDVCETEIYSVNKYGDYKRRVLSEDKIEVNYITNENELVYSNYSTGETICELNGNSKALYGEAAKNILYFENEGELLIKTDNDNLIYCNEDSKRIIASEVEEIYYVEKKSGDCSIRNISLSNKTTSEVTAIFYTRGKNRFYIDISSMKDSVIVDTCNLDLDKIKMINDKEFYCYDSSMSYKFLDGVWSKENKESKFYNLRGKGYLTIEEGEVTYYLKKNKETICNGDEILLFIDKWIYFTRGNNVYRLNIDERSEELLFDNKVIIRVNYE